VSIQENFLPQEMFTMLRDTAFNIECPWYFNPEVTTTDEEDTPGFFFHMIYNAHAARSPFYDQLFCPIFNMMEIAVLLKVQMNLNPRFQEPFVSPFHIDLRSMTEVLAVNSTTSILYINTNNGYTELDTGEKIESIANRLVSFPSSTRHRAVTQTDEQTRIVVNFNYLKHRHSESNVRWHASSEVPI